MSGSQTVGGAGVGDGEKSRRRRMSGDARSQRF